MVEPQGTVEFSCRANGFQHDVVEASVDVPAGRVVLGGVAVPAHPLLERRHRFQETPCHVDGSDVSQYISLGTDQLVGLRQHRGATMSDHFAGHGARERVGREAGERVGSPALQRDPQIRQRPLGPRLPGHRREPAGHDAGGAGQVLGETGPAREERVRHRQWPPQVRTGERGPRLVDDEHRADVRVYEEPGQHGEQEPVVVGPAVLAALRVRRTGAPARSRRPRCGRFRTVGSSGRPDTPRARRTSRLLAVQT
jgi:hypothetical protein